MQTINRIFKYSIFGQRQAFLCLMYLSYSRAYILHNTNNCERANCISPFHHFTIDGNVSPKKDTPLEDFTISPLHHNDFTISTYVRKILIHHHTIWKTKKNHCIISPQNHIDTFQSSYHITTSPYHDFTISPFHCVAKM